ncbi:hypothetical protein GBL98_02095 [Yersinia pseudotuberculosis]|uniref:hypothetical protein n=2 Tax=Yersinia pseudotuberculosis TaxID=633 RepID=UPI0006621553|nr:hypothetical protein [Yersinia pseudotuberculosis]AYX15078.1 hypothetical protein EGX44_07690 [Yersinia pseudotuberculosis]MBO1605344.1 hypothetical protein [Yersinia pseudotuberculosis]MBO1609497.1 hypothetical protein [Yersinia pseudotuberculosis]MBO1619954.1 hypothetical protein [Yersinia pseudotuberculosis]PSH21508.1 hypothetical protein BLA52_00585 [Yersinia pseudotuberculosis]
MEETEVMAATQALVKTIMVEPEEMGATLVDAAPQVEMVGVVVMEVVAAILQEDKVGMGVMRVTVVLLNNKVRGKYENS